MTYELRVTSDIVQDAVNIQNGVYAPLDGFLYEDDFCTVLNKMRLFDGQVWSIPIVINIHKRDYLILKKEKRVVLTDGHTKVYLFDVEVYPFDKQEFAFKVYGTRDCGHPGVCELGRMGDFFLGGRIERIENYEKIFGNYNFTPQEMREIFKKRGWKKIAAFQTRNIPHMGHEFLQKEALRETDGILIHPVIGKKMAGDFEDIHIINSYNILIDNYFEDSSAILGVLPLKMRYAGPREAVMHALIRRNFGCTHFIVGRDHAGVGNYYPSLAAQNIFDDFSGGEIGIEVLKYGEVVYDRVKDKHDFIDMVFRGDRINFSGTKLREIIKNKETPPKYLIREDIYKYLVGCGDKIFRE